MSMAPSWLLAISPVVAPVVTDHYDRPYRAPITQHSNPGLPLVALG
jgi:hypothetical protein